MSNSAWKERLEQEYGRVPLPEDPNYHLQYQRLREFKADPNLYRKYSGYREAFLELYAEPEIFTEESQRNPNYTIMDYAYDYDLMDSPYERAKYLLQQGNVITVGVYPQFTPQPDFRTEFEILEPFASDLGDVYEPFIANPTTTEIEFILRLNPAKKLRSKIQINAVHTKLTTRVPIRVGLDLLEKMIPDFMVVCGDLNITSL